MRARKGIVGGKPRNWQYMHDIEQRAKRLRKVCAPPKQRKLLPGEENQLLLPGV